MQEHPIRDTTALNRLENQAIEAVQRAERSRQHELQLEQENRSLRRLCEEQKETSREATKVQAGSDSEEIRRLKTLLDERQQKNEALHFELEQSRQARVSLRRPSPITQHSDHYRGPGNTPRRGIVHDQQPTPHASAGSDVPQSSTCMSGDQLLNTDVNEDKMLSLDPREEGLSSRRSLRHHASAQESRESRPSLPLSPTKGGNAHNASTPEVLNDQASNLDSFSRFSATDNGLGASSPHSPLGDS